jgi:ATP/maltotriose-dependent transcriptional regulator MalT
VALIETHAMSLIVQWYAQTVNGWVPALPPEWRAKSPRTNLAFAWNQLLHGDIKQAAPHLEQLAAIFSNSQEGEDPFIQAEWLALQAWLQNAQGHPSQGLVLANLALETVPEADSYNRSLIYMALAGAYQQLDDYSHSVEAYQKLIMYGRTAGNITSELLGIAALGQIALFPGKYHYTFEIASQGVERIERSGSLHSISTAVFGELAEIHYQ